MKFFSTPKGPLSFSISGTLNSSGCSCQGFLYLGHSDYKKTKCPKELSGILFSPEVEIVLFRKESPHIYFLLKGARKAGEYEIVGDTLSRVGAIALSQLTMLSQL